MAVLRMCRNAQHFREFVNDPITGHHYTNTCGETALAAAMVCSTKKDETLAETISLMTALTREMMGLHWADSPNGATTTGHLHDEAIRRGFKVAAHYVQWEDPVPGTDLHPWLLYFAGIMPIVLMITNGQALRAIDGSHDEIGLHGHFITIVGLADEGYICEDGDNSAIASHLVTYSWATIQAAHVTGFLMLENEQEVSMGVPTGWSDDGKLLHAPSAHDPNVMIAIDLGFRDKVLAWPGGWDAGNRPFGPSYGKSDAEGGIEPGNPNIGAGTRIDFNWISLGWTPKMGVYQIWTGQDLLAYQKRIADLQAQVNAGTLTDQQKADIALGQAFRTAVKAA